ncbi:winged helix-turn-helix transcriptional regulator [Ramlibacter tataouinensis]|uniref:HTH hxlR-type domain-containing protein n=1 Tax=Ramlibacter tataouinensis (strain ATCC BAA-407 / DSM 14655 / LMG 21543 / TTB310) TaxID=365046 RepID=F5XW16_RAMTT|nr:helix-turn-helix domain-containing protein [Ramlibacter tataouinensis]AEG94119.1 conserved hypothetical protein [Ramlibacter tataouinensis TTB310]
MPESPKQALIDEFAARVILDQIADKWSVMILTVLCTEPSRFNAVKRRLGSITQKALTQALRRLERNGLIARRVITSSPIAVEYSITPLGRTLKDPVFALCAWTLAHEGEVERAQQEFDTRDQCADGHGHNEASRIVRHAPFRGQDRERHLVSDEADDG